MVGAQLEEELVSLQEQLERAEHEKVVLARELNEEKR